MLCCSSTTDLRETYKQIFDIIVTIEAATYPVVGSRNISAFEKELVVLTGRLCAPVRLYLRRVAPAPLSD